MSKIEVFLFICVGYLVIWGAAFGFVQVWGNTNSLVQIATFSLLASLVVFYPPAAIGYFFYNQTTNRLWLIPSLLAVFSALILFGTWVYDFWDGGLDDYAALLYFGAGFLLSELIALPTIILSCLAKFQHRFTRIAGGVTLIVTICTVGAFSAVQFKLVQNIFNFEVMLLLLTSPLIFGAISLLMAVFLNSPNQNNLETTSPDFSIHS